MRTEELRCPRCGAAMNHHAEKIDFSEPEVDAIFGGRLFEVHQCPQCGAVADRDAGVSGSEL